MKKTVLLLAGALIALLMGGCPGVGEDPEPAASFAPPVVIPGADRLTLFWTPVPEAASYAVWYGPSADRRAAAKAEDPVDVDTTAVITGLSGPGPYHVWIRAKNADGVIIGWSAPAQTAPARVFDTGEINALTVDLPSYIRGADGGSPDNPVPVAISGDLGAENYRRLLTMIKRAGKYVALDLGGVIGSGSGAGFRPNGIFDPVVPEGAESEGAALIAALILPDDTGELKTAATFYNAASFIHQYVGLRYLFSEGLSDYDNYAGGARALFIGLTELRAVSLPGFGNIPVPDYFSGCTNLVTVSMPALLNLSGLPAPGLYFTQRFGGTFDGCPHLELVTVSAEIEKVFDLIFGAVCVKARMNLAGAGEARVLAGGKALVTANGKYMIMAPPTEPYRLDLGDTTFDQGVFEGDGFITALVLSATVGSVSFRDCVSLKELTLLRAAPPAGGLSAFTNTPGDLVIRVPAGSVDAYRAAWPGKDIRPLP